ncbi:FecR family protein [Olivibacter domesticus]|uniref:FecR family protein n=1 Tax=Olivibacter domesticus TaxID=407022 RepID=A0A1H7XXT4_OLID1|nr:FecR family protein [Olivibacter domesticus]SEM38475.1 FecR family protein [Olivibacter domesticus]
MEQNQRYQKLASKWLSNTISDEEKREFAAWYNSNQDKEIFIYSAFGEDEEKYRKHLLEKILQLTASSEKENLKASTVKRKLGVFVAAAAIICLVVAGILLHRENTKIVKTDKIVSADLSRDTNHYENKAIITLATGKVIMLDSIKVGDVVEEEGVMVSKPTKSTIHYCFNKASSIGKGQLANNKISIPFGKEYKLVFSDGSKVWLNAGSALSFPRQFARKERRVTLNGEAYFMVNHLSPKKAIPFIVETRLQKVYVLGTEFNVNAYEDEGKISTTLINGAVKVKQIHNEAIAILKPNQQAIVSPTSSEIKIKKVDVSEIISWKHGYFNFNDSDIQTVMRQFARWYDVDVIYERRHVADVFVGKIPKSLSLDEALNVLETVGVKFKIEGRKLTII